MSSVSSESVSSLVLVLCFFEFFLVLEAAAVDDFPPQISLGPIRFRFRGVKLVNKLSAVDSLELDVGILGAQDGSSSLSALNTSSISSGSSMVTTGFSIGFRLRPDFLLLFPISFSMTSSVLIVISSGAAKGSEVARTPLDLMFNGTSLAAKKGQK